jgi:hypothetical protein
MPHRPFCSPTYFQAAKVASPLSSGLYTFPLAVSIAPAAIVQSICVSKMGRYKYWVCAVLLSFRKCVLRRDPQNLVGWALMLIGVGLLSTLRADTPILISALYQIITAFGLGFEYATTFAVLAHLDASLNAQALAFLMFSRTFAQV